MRPSRVVATAVFPSKGFECDMWACFMQPQCWSDKLLNLSLSKKQLIDLLVHKVAHSSTGVILLHYVNLLTQIVFVFAAISLSFCNWNKDLKGNYLWSKNWSSVCFYFQGSQHIELLDLQGTCLPIVPQSIFVCLLALLHPLMHKAYSRSN